MQRGKNPHVKTRRFRTKSHVDLAVGLPSPGHLASTPNTFSMSVSDNETHSSAVAIES